MRFVKHTWIKTIFIFTANPEYAIVSSHIDKSFGHPRYFGIEKLQYDCKNANEGCNENDVQCYKGMKETGLHTAVSGIQKQTMTN